MEYPWLKSYPNGVPTQISFDGIDSILSVVKKAVDSTPEGLAFSNMGQSLTYKEIDRLSDAFASFLQHELKLKKGDKIALQMPNLLQYPVALIGSLKAGLVIVNTNPLYTPREMLHQFNDSGAVAVVILANFASLLSEILPQTKIESVIVTQIGDMLPFPKSLVVNSVVKYIKKMVPNYNLPQAYKFMDVLSIGSKRSLDPIKLNLDDLAFLQYTGGTTGVSKGAMLTHRNIVANMLQIVEWMKPELKQNQESIITALPMYHIFSLTVNTLAFMYFGGHNILVTNPRDIPAFIKLLRTSRFTVMTGVNTLFNALMNHPDFDTIDFSKLKLSVAGAMALQTSVAEKWKARTKTKIFEGYGLTEASPVVCCNPITDGADRPGSVGIPLPSTQVKLVDDSGKEVPPGTAGELLAKGPQVMLGYYNRIDETSQVLKDGWLKTGDIAELLEDGFFRIVDRKKDMILVSGFNVYPNEVEDVIATMPEVLEVAVIGIPDETSGEVPKAFIVKKDSLLSEEKVIAHCRKQLTGYKIPKAIEFRTELPKTNVGKILRRQLRSN